MRLNHGSDGRRESSSDVLMLQSRMRAKMGRFAHTNSMNIERSYVAETCYNLDDLLGTADALCHASNRLSTLRFRAFKTCIPHEFGNVMHGQFGSSIPSRPFSVAVTLSALCFSRGDGPTSHTSRAVAIRPSSSPSPITSQVTVIFVAAVPKFTRATTMRLLERGPAQICRWEHGSLVPPCVCVCVPIGKCEAHKFVNLVTRFHSQKSKSAFQSGMPSGECQLGRT